MNKTQSASTLIMIEPICFRMNEQTVINNYYQKQEKEGSTFEIIQKKALIEFNGLVEILQKHRIKVIVLKDNIENNTPDSIFPNNWLSFHQNGNVCLFPMFAENRRKERRMDLLDILKDKGFIINKIVDLTTYEKKNLFLEGTGSIVLDRISRKAYCSLSPRSSRIVLEEFCKIFNYTPIIFHAYQNVKNKRKLIYHTNVMMCIADKYAIISLDSIDDDKEKKHVLRSLVNDGKEIIELSELQLNKFAGNMLVVRNSEGLDYLVMSSQAYSSLSKYQLNKLKSLNPIIHSNLQTIETNGGGSARCMIAEVYLPRKQ